MLFIREELLKSEHKSDSSKPSASTKGEQRGGDYIARIQIGYERDGSPKYRYFKSEEEYESYLSSRGRSKSAKQLEDKVKKEHKESTEKHGKAKINEPKHPVSEKKKHGLLAGEKTTKSLRLYVRM